MDNHIIYVHTLNGKIYIGQTFGSKPSEWKRRFQNGRGYEGCILFSKAIRKYGWENVTTDILFEGLSQDEANMWEELLIRLYDSTNKKVGYNISLGGSGYNRGKNCHSKDYRKKEKNEWRKNRYNSDEEYRKSYNQRANQYRVNGTHYREYQREWHKKNREAYLQSDEYKDKQRILEERKVLREQAKAAKRKATEERKKESQRRKAEKESKTKEYFTMLDSKMEERRQLVRLGGDIRQKVLRHCGEQIRKAKTEAAKQRWRDEREYLKSIPVTK